MQLKAILGIGDMVDATQSMRNDVAQIEQQMAQNKQRTQQVAKKQPLSRKKPIVFAATQQWDTQPYIDSLNKRARDTPDVKRYQKQTEALINKYKQVQDVVTRRDSCIMFVQNGAEFYVIKIFATIDGFNRECGLLDMFDGSDVLRKYITDYDYETERANNAIIYRRLISAHNLLSEVDPRLVNDALLWGKALMQDAHKEGIRLCDLKLDNVLYDINLKQFFLTDLESIVPASKKCDLNTFIQPFIDFDPYIFDYLHYVASFGSITGTKEAIAGELRVIANLIISETPISQSFEELYSILEAIAFMHAPIEFRTISRIKQAPDNQSRYPKKYAHSIDKYARFIIGGVIQINGMRYQSLCDILTKLQADIQEGVRRSIYGLMHEKAKQNSIVDVQMKIAVSYIYQFYRNQSVRQSFVDLIETMQLLRNPQTMQKEGMQSRRVNFQCDEFVFAVLLFLIGFAFVLRQNQLDSSFCIHKHCGDGCAVKQFITKCNGVVIAKWKNQ